MNYSTIPSTLPCDSAPLSSTLPCPVSDAGIVIEASEADINLALAGLPSLAMRCPIVPHFTTEELALASAI